VVAGESEGIGTALSEEPGGSDDALYGPRRSSHSKPIVCCALAIAMTVMGCLVMGIAMIQGSWWYPVMTGPELSREHSDGSIILQNQAVSILIGLEADL